MPSSPTQTVPSVRSRHRKDTAQRAEVDAANEWITSNTLETRTCPVKAVTRVITTETSTGKTILSKYDVIKLQGLYGAMRSTERVHIVKDLRMEVHLRQQRVLKWRQLMKMVAAKQGSSEGQAPGAWKLLSTACKEALENTEELQARLAWCEQNFESGMLTPAMVAERRVWDEGAEMELRGEE